MRVLLVHQNFPGQFLHLAPALVAEGHRVDALTAEGNRRPVPDGVTLWRYRAPPAPPAADTARLGTAFCIATDRGLAAARAARQLRDRHGYVPDLIYGHPGWGETLFLREVWPQARLILYAEFYYASRGLDVGFDPEFGAVTDDRAFAVQARLGHHALAMSQAHAAVAPTRFQADTFPDCFRQKISVIHDGIDTDRIRPNPAARLQLPSGQVLAPGDEVLSYVSRNLEPYRGFHVFLRALPAVLARRPELQVVIMGGDGVSYGSAPADHPNWRSALLAEVGARLDLSRVHFLGHQPFEAFVSLLQVTRVHCHLTVPFVLSWSLLEAMAAGAMVVGSRTPPLAEVITDGRTGRLVAFPNVPDMAEALVETLAAPARNRPCQTAARAHVVDTYDLRRTCLPQQLAYLAGQSPHTTGRAGPG